MEVQKFSYDNKIVKYFAYATVIWGIIGMLVGLIAALQLAFPEFFNDYLGFSFLSFDVSDVGNILAFQGFWDTDFGYMDIFNTDGEFVGDTNFVLSAASVNVPEPGTMFLLLASVGGLLLRRRV